MTDDLKSLILKRDFSLEDIKKLARKHGYRSMFEDALVKISVGITTLEEALRVIRE
jgi:type II secretory ATPase GspE/PulE/Tfp pilus assembly ATPase PilB-like protein